MSSEYYCNWFTSPESMLLGCDRTVWGVYRRINQNLSWRIDVCESERQALSLCEALENSPVGVEVGVW